MLPSTKNFLIKVHEALNELGYHPKSSVLNFEDFKLCAFRTLNHAEQLEDAIDAAKMIQFIIQNHQKINDNISEHFDFWKTLRFEGNELLSLVGDEQASGAYTITNAFDSDYKSIFLSGHSLGDEDACRLIYEKGKFSCYEVSNYFLRFSKMSANEMVVMDREDRKMCIIVLDDNLNISLKNNQTNYEIMKIGNGMAIYLKSYIDSLKGEEPDDEEAQALISWDILDEKSDLGLVRMGLCEIQNDKQMELFILFAASCLLLYKSYINFSNVAGLYAASSWMRR